MGVLARDAVHPRGVAEIAGRTLMRRSASVTDAPRIRMRPLPVRAVVIDGFLENIRPMRSLAAGAHLEITHRSRGIMPDLPERRAMAGAAHRAPAMPKGWRGDRRQAGAGR